MSSSQQGSTLHSHHVGASKTVELTCVGFGPLHVRLAGPAPVAASQPEGQSPATVGLLLPSGTHSVGTGEMGAGLAGATCTISRPVKSSSCVLETSMAGMVLSVIAFPSPGVTKLVWSVSLCS